MTTAHVEQAAISPYVELFRTCVTAAYEAGASDIHIEPTRNGIDIRFRVFGDMRPPWKTLGAEHRHSFTVSVKKETRLAIGVSGRPQDSRCNVEGVPVDLRVNLLPTLFGEKIVLRILDAGREFGIENLGIPESTLSDLLAALNYRNGVVLISGPTGSGKTTTLYSLLCAVDRSRKNVVTLEDPIEYTMAGINQVRIDAKISFASALRAVLRQDPDVILIGEIRDEETASLAFKAAATGHLVLSTVHANGATEVIGRLLNLGIDKDSLRENLRFSAAQRLVPKLCKDCSTLAPSDIAMAAISEVPHQLKSSTATFRIKSESGCCKCHGGIIGRVPAIEYLTKTKIMTYLAGCDGGTKLVQSLQDAAHELAARGDIDVREVKAIG